MKNTANKVTKNKVTNTSRTAPDDGILKKNIKSLSVSKDSDKIIKYKVCSFDSKGEEMVHYILCKLLRRKPCNIWTQVMIPEVTKCRYDIGYMYLKNLIIIEYDGPHHWTDVDQKNRDLMKTTMLMNNYESFVLRLHHSLSMQDMETSIQKFHSMIRAVSKQKIISHNARVMYVPESCYRYLPVYKSYKPVK